MITIRNTGKFEKTFKFLNKAPLSKYLNIFDKYGRRGVQALSDATPQDSGTTANSWFYTIQRTRRGMSISWNNSNVSDGIPIVILIQYGHGTSQGGYVQGVDFINPVLKSIFTNMIDDIWKEVTS